MGAIKAGTLVVERAGEECNGFVSSRMRKWQAFDILAITGHYCGISKKGKLSSRRDLLNDRIKEVEENHKENRVLPPCRQAQFGMKSAARASTACRLQSGAEFRFKFCLELTKPSFSLPSSAK
jgi:hypothetical protein